MNETTLKIGVLLAGIGATSVLAFLGAMCIAFGMHSERDDWKRDCQTMGVHRISQGSEIYQCKVRP